MLDKSTPHENANSESSVAKRSRKSLSAISLGVAGAALGLLSAGCGGKVYVEENTEYTEPVGDAGMEDTGTTDTQDAEPDSPSQDAPDCNFVRISGSNFSPGNITVPRGATNVKWTCLDLENGCNLNTVGNISFVHQGTGNPRDLSDIRIIDLNGTNFSGPIEFNESNRVDFIDDFDLATNQTTTVCITADIEPEAMTGATHSIELMTSEDIILEGGPEIMGDFPIEGDLMTVSAVGTGHCTVERAGKLTDIPSGQQQALISQFRIHCEGEDGYLENFALSLPGSCSSQQMENFSLYVDDQPGAINAPVIPSVDFAVISPAAPLLIEAGNMNTFWVMADVNCPAGTQVKSCIESGADFTIEGGVYGYYLPVANEYDCENNSQSADVY